VSSNGICQWVPPGRFSTPCPIDISWFPFDDQTCSLTFQSWLYTSLKLNLTLAFDTVDKDFMNGEWNLLGKHGRLSTADDNVVQVTAQMHLLTDEQLTATER